MWWQRWYCRMTGHPGVFREWEWKPTHPQWRERQDAWTCIRCRAEVPSVPLGSIEYFVARPLMDSRLIDQINHAVEQYGTESVRIRAGNPDTRQPRPTGSRS